MVFRLPRPTPEQPFIAGLLDPCTNSMIAPNIPAQVLYDKKVCRSLIHWNPCNHDGLSTLSCVSRATECYKSLIAQSHRPQFPSSCGSTNCIVSL